MAAASKPDDEAAAADEMRRVAKSYQYDRYMAALLMPRRHREALLLLTGFGAELNRIPDVAREPMMAAVRLQWWRDAVSAMAQPGAHTLSGHPFADALGEMVRARSLPFGLLQGMIDAAEGELDPTPFTDPDERRRLIVKFDGALFELAGLLLGARLQRDIWQDAAVAYGGARLASEFGWRRETGRQTYATRADGPAGQGSGIECAMIDQVQRALRDVRGRYGELDAAGRGALLPLAVVTSQLRRLAMPVQHSNGRRSVVNNFVRARAVLWAHWRGKI